jgi:hypothetical protein
MRLPAVFGRRNVTLTLLPEVTRKNRFWTFPPRRRACAASRQQDRAADRDAQRQHEQPERASSDGSPIVVSPADELAQRVPMRQNDSVRARISARPSASFRGA